MTIKYTYTCSNCSHNYVEQRGKDEPNPYFTTCSSCKSGTYEEIDKEILAPEPERQIAPIQVALEENIIEE